MDLANARRVWRETAERYAQNRKEAIAEGKHIGKPPFGYRFADPTPKKGSHGVLDSRLVIDPERAPIVRETLRAQGHGRNPARAGSLVRRGSPRSRRGSFGRAPP